MKRVCLLILALLTPSLVAAQSPLEITGYFSQANDINNAGQVVGYVTTASGAPQAFVWTAADGMQDLGTSGGNGSSANGINDVGQVVGYATTPSGGYQAFLWTAADGMQDVGSVPSCDQQHTGCKTWIPKVST